MKQAFLLLLTGSVTFFFMSLAGMAVFGEQRVLAMAEAGCTSGACIDLQNHGIPGGECLEHCLSTTSAATAATIFSAVIGFAGIMVLFWFIAGRSSPVTPLLLPSKQRWRDGIGRALLRQHVCTFIIQD